MATLPEIAVRSIKSAETLLGITNSHTFSDSIKQQTMAICKEAAGKGLYEAKIPPDFRDVYDQNQVTIGTNLRNHGYTYDETTGIISWFDDEITPTNTNENIILNASTMRNITFHALIEKAEEPLRNIGI